MSRYLLSCLSATGMAMLPGGPVFAALPMAAEILYATHGGIVAVPASSQAFPADAGVRAHTNIRIFFRNGDRSLNAAPPVGAETPASLACVYGFVAATAGCNPASAKTVPAGGSKLVLIVDAYDDPTASSDLGVYSSQFGLPAVTGSNFQVVYAAGTKPAQDSTGGWELEESLDIEMAHAMAPGAKVVLVEAASDNMADLLAAETAAANLAVAAGGGEISNSWGSAEFKSEGADENYFSAANTVFVAATGDSLGTEFPSVLQNVVAAGGTTINRDGNHNYINQSPWSPGGGGVSSYIAIPSYQAALKQVRKVAGSQRGTPDFAFDANPDSGVAVYDTTPYEGSVLNWIVVGGTSVASPALAATINAASHFASSTAAELTTVYGNYPNASNWTDIVKGSCQNGSVLKGYDLCTGLGVPNGYGGK